jgi:hypothetical protein
MMAHLAIDLMILIVIIAFLYASSQRVGCYVETLARFRPDLSLLAELSDIQGDDDFVVLGSVPSEWFTGRSMGGASTAGVYAEIYASGWVGHLRQKLSKLAIALDLPDIDTATLQRDSRWIHHRDPTRLVMFADDDSLANCQMCQ